MPSRRVRVVLGWQRQHAPRVCAAFVGELHAVCIRGTPTLPALELLPSEKRNLTDGEKRPYTAKWWPSGARGALGSPYGDRDRTRVEHLQLHGNQVEKEAENEAGEAHKLRVEKTFPLAPTRARRTRPPTDD